MLVYKAVRHIVLAQALRAIKILQQAGYAAYASEVSKTAESLEFSPCSPDSSDMDDHRDGKEFLLIRVIYQNEVRFHKQIPASLFRLYGRDSSNLTNAGKDVVQESNAAIARDLFRELHVARIGAALDEPTAKVLAGESLPPIAVTEPPTPRAVWGVLAALCVVAFLLSTWQGTRSFNFIDTTYLIENLNLLARGKIPYKDFFLVLPPLHYLLHLVPFKISGNIMSLVYSGAAVQTLSVLATFWACQAVVRAPWFNLLFAAIPAVTGVAMLGQPIYDCDAVLAATLAIGALLIAERYDGKTSTAWAFAGGVAIACSIAIKINIGLPLLFGVLLVLVIGRLLFVKYSFRSLLAMLLGVAMVLSLTGIWLWSHGALGPMFEQIVSFPAKVRLHPVANLIHSLPLPRKLEFGHYYAWAVLLALLWILVGFRWFAGSHRRPLSMMLPVVLMAVCLGTMQSQDYGSVYGLGPVAALTLTMGYQFSSKLFGGRGAVIIAAFALFFIITAIKHDLRQERLRFMGELLTSPQKFSETHLQGVSGFAPTVKGFESAVKWAKEFIRPGESVFWWPGTAPFYWATGLVNPLPNFQVYADTGLSPAAAVEQLHSKKVQWVFVDQTSQKIEAFGKFSEIAPVFNIYYTFTDKFDNVSVYRLKSE